MKTTFKIGLFVLSLMLLNCSDNQNEIRDNINQEIDIAKQNLKINLNSKENSIIEIFNSYAESSKIDKEILKNDMELSYMRLKERAKKVASGELTIDDFYKDVNGAFNDNNGFNTDLGRLISSYHREKYLSNSRVNDESFESYKRVQELKKEQ
jgi:hypothetical protein